MTRSRSACGITENQPAFIQVFDGPGRSVLVRVAAVLVRVAAVLVRVAAVLVRVGQSLCRDCPGRSLVIRVGAVLLPCSCRVCPCSCRVATGVTVVGRPSTLENPKMSTDRPGS